MRRESLTIIVALALFGCLTPAYADQPTHVCGRGPQTIKIEREHFCGDISRPRPVLQGDGRYRYNPETQTDIVPTMCTHLDEETWSDWPECIEQGAQLLSSRTYDGCNWTTCDAGGFCSTTAMGCVGGGWLEISE